MKGIHQITITITLIASRFGDRLLQRLCGFHGDPDGECRGFPDLDGMLRGRLQSSELSARIT